MESFWSETVLLHHVRHACEVGHWHIHVCVLCSCIGQVAGAKQQLDFSVWWHFVTFNVPSSESCFLKYFGCMLRAFIQFIRRTQITAENWHCVAEGFAFSCCPSAQCLGVFFIVD